MPARVCVPGCGRRPVIRETIRQLRAALAVGVFAAVLLGAPAAFADSPYDPGGFRLSSANYAVHEHDGAATITITRTDTSEEAHAGYIAVGMGHPCGAQQCSATSPVDAYHVPGDFRATQGTLDFPAGVASRSFQVPIVDHHFATIDKTVSVGIFASWPIGTAHPDHAVLTILGDEPTPPRDPQNPLDLPLAPGADNPLRGAAFVVDQYSGAAPYVSRYPVLGAIADQPGVARFGTFSGSDVGIAVNRYLARADAEAPRHVAMLATYKLVDLHCGHWTPTPATQADYHHFVTRFAQGIGSARAVLFLEMDSLITAGCLTDRGLAIRLHELGDAIDTLTADCPHLVIYLDAGAADAIAAPRMAGLLRRAGVAKIQGFFLNSTHFDWTSKEILYGEQISRMVGGKHFVINTSFNGRGPLKPPDPARQGNEVLCNPFRRGLGPKTTTSTGFRNVDAFVWMTNPGESFGQCHPGQPPMGAYWPEYGEMLVRNAVYTVDSTVSLKQFLLGNTTQRAG